MSKNRRKNKFVLKQRFLVSFILVVGIVEFVLSVSLFAVYSYSQLRIVREFTLSQLKQASGAADILHDQILTIHNSILSDSLVQQMLVSDTVSHLNEADVVRHLRTIQSAYSYIHSSGIYCPKTERYINTNNVFPANTFDVAPLYAALEQSGASSMPRVVFLSPLRHRKTSVYTFVFKVQTSYLIEQDALIIIDIEQDYLFRLIQYVMDDSDQREVAVINQSNQIISHPQSSLFMLDMQQLPYAENLNLNADNMGSVIYRDGRLNLLTYVYSPVTGWLFTSTQPMSSISGDIPLWGIMTLVISLVLFVLGLLFSMRASNYLYSPIRKLYDSYVNRQKEGDASAPHQVVNELYALDTSFAYIMSKTDSLESALESSLSIARYTYVRYLLEGSPLSHNETMYREMGIDLDALHFQPILIEYEELNQPQAQSSELHLLHYALENIASELLDRVARHDFIFFGRNRFVALLYLQPDALEGDILPTINELSVVMSREFSLSLACCIGKVVEDWQGITIAYSEADIVLKQRLSSNSSVVLDAKVECSEIRVTSPPKGLQNQLAEALRAGNESELTELQEKLLEHLSTLSWMYAQNYCKHIMLAVLSRFDKLQDIKGEFIREAYYHIEQVDACLTLCNIRNVLDAFWDVLHQGLQIKSSGAANNAVQFVVDYLEENYADPNLSMNLLADMVQLSPAYLGRQFSMSVAEPFTDYLNGIRLRQAKELLEKTNLPIAEISKKVGILNANWFYSIFKKYYGMTPGHYRRNQTRKK